MSSNSFVFAVTGGELSLRLVITLLHLLWQGVAVGAVVLVGTRLLRKSSASSRYVLHAAALVCLPLCVAVTLVAVEVPESWTTNSAVDASEAPASVSTDHGPVTATETTPTGKPADSVVAGASEDEELAAGDQAQLAQQTASEEPENAVDATGVASGTASVALPIFQRLAPVIAVAYLAAASLLLMRLIVATWGGHRLRSAARRIDDPRLLKLISEQARKVGLRLAPSVAYCERVAVPMVVGVLRPVVLLPASIVTGLEPQQFAAIISHEFAHVRRYDLLMNLVQRLVESLLFFHPVVWYVSRRMSAEREACCDDLVVLSGYEPMHYAGALLRMAELCSTAMQAGSAAVAASGRSASHFETRIQRLMNLTREPRLRLTRFGAFCIALLMISIAIAPAIFRNLAHPQANAEGVAASLPTPSEHPRPAEDNRSVAERGGEPTRSGKDDLAQLHGKWVVRSVKIGGKATPAQIGREVGDVITIKKEGARAAMS